VKAEQRQRGKQSVPMGGPCKRRFSTQDFLLVGVLLSGHAAKDVLRLAEHLWAPEVPSHYSGRTPISFPDVGWGYSTSRWNIYFQVLNLEVFRARLDGALSNLV